MNTKIKEVSIELAKANIRISNNEKRAWAQYPIPNLHDIATHIHDEDLPGQNLPGQKPNKGGVECAIDIEGKYAKNIKVINALKSLNCWQKVLQNTRNKGWRFIYYISNSNTSASEIAKEKLYFRNTKMNEVSRAIITNL